MLVTDVLMRTISPGRQTALLVLEAVAEGAYASDSLLELTRRLSSRDAGLASQIVFGVLRFQSQLDFLITRFSGKKPETLDLPVLLALRTAIFQLRYLERIPAHAAVHETVEYIKAKRRAAAGLTNAVLRKVNRDPIVWPDQATELACPAWLLDRWSNHFGGDMARAIASAALQKPSVYIRNPPCGLPVSPTSVAGCFRVDAELPPGIRSQDIGSQSLIPLLELRSGTTYLDLCAAPGNKTLQAMEFHPQLAVACDISFRRLLSIPAICPRVALDATQPLPFRRLFDRILVDAPCSGTGTLARNPEIKWRVQSDDFARFREKQIRILLQAAESLAPEGRLVYATCSLEPEENEQVVKAALGGNPRLRTLQETWRIPGRDEGDGFYIAVLKKISP